MTKVDARTLDFFDRNVVLLICEKYGLDEKKALRELLESETYQMLVDRGQEVYRMSPIVVFDMWENEKVTGEPRNSQYIRGDY
jgi:predicted DsbA family dithiol-disulfide isomerase